MERAISSLSFRLPTSVKWTTKGLNPDAFISLMDKLIRPLGFWSQRLSRYPMTMRQTLVEEETKVVYYSS